MTRKMSSIEGEGIKRRQGRFFREAAQTIARDVWESGRRSDGLCGGSCWHRLTEQGWRVFQTFAPAQGISACTLLARLDVGMLPWRFDCIQPWITNATLTHARGAVLLLQSSTAPCQGGLNPSSLPGTGHGDLWFMCGCSRDSYPFPYIMSVSRLVRLGPQLCRLSQGLSLVCEMRQKPSRTTVWCL